MNTPPTGAQWLADVPPYNGPLTPQYGVPYTYIYAGLHDEVNPQHLDQSYQRFGNAPFDLNYDGRANSPHEVNRAFSHAEYEYHSPARLAQIQGQSNATQERIAAQTPPVAGLYLYQMPVFFAQMDQRYERGADNKIIGPIPRLPAGYASDLTVDTYITDQSGNQLFHLATTWTMTVISFETVRSYPSTPGVPDRWRIKDYRLECRVSVPVIGDGAPGGEGESAYDEEFEESLNQKRIVATLHEYFRNDGSTVDPQLVEGVTEPPRPTPAPGEAVVIVNDFYTFYERIKAWRSFGPFDLELPSHYTIRVVVNAPNDFIRGEKACLGGGRWITAFDDSYDEFRRFNASTLRLATKTVSESGRLVWSDRSSAGVLYVSAGGSKGTTLTRFEASPLAFNPPATYDRAQVLLDGEQVYCACRNKGSGFVELLKLTFGFGTGPLTGSWSVITSMFSFPVKGYHFTRTPYGAAACAVRKVGTAYTLVTKVTTDLAHWPTDAEAVEVASVGAGDEFDMDCVNGVLRLLGTAGVFRISRRGGEAGSWVTI